MTDKKELIALSKKLNKKYPDARVDFKAKLIHKGVDGKKREVWYIKTYTIYNTAKSSVQLWVPDRYKAGIKYGKEVSYIGYGDNY